ncbi:DNA replication protein DnaC [Desulfotomaculum arcticum]|uniref:DNA replication protein DnaC n=1 Tax=Desulfotruncus arcticus DSM 17038 TaxID=1121424 RepID=A0A1I2YAQ1_9FIRM|nr:ATP-binding protein [Desulfotruncus arcticus]SFH22770.1 DNA replication protein DnaC [Desulfotomaculum arcticum] [Desulfotruncus arcticus DSM 17038]
MDVINDKCLLAQRCKKAGEPGQCNRLCFPYTKLQGETGTGGLWGLADIPKTYRFIIADQLPFRKANPAAWEVICRYCKHVLDFVQEQHMGLYLYSVPNKDNPKGSGTGKTTAAVAVVNEFLVARVIQHVKREKLIKKVPALFISVPRFQNVFNKQFRGPRDLHEEASLKYYKLKELMMEAELLVLDDAGIRESTAAFNGEFYEVIDERAVEARATILTSNEPLATIANIYDERTASRIEGFTVPVKFFGKDYRKAGWTE